MKVLYLVESAAPYGANKSLVELIDQLADRGVTPFVVGSYHGPLADWLETRGVFYRAIGHRLSVYPKSNGFLGKLMFIPKTLAIRYLNLLAFIRLVLLCRQLSPDIIHTNVGPSTIGYWAARLMGIRHVWHLREYQDLDFSLKIFPSKSKFINLLKRSDFVICITPAIARHFSVSGKYRVINDGVGTRNDLHFDPDKEGYFLFAGRLEPTKGIDVVIDGYMAFCKKYGACCKLAIAGDGHPDYVAELQTFVAQSLFADNVTFLGFRNDTLHLMQKAKALLVASRSEGFGRITPEAMFNGCLVIGRNTGGTAEILDAGGGEKIGLLFDDEAQMVDNMGAVAAMSAKEYQDIVLRAQAKALDKYCIEHHAGEVFSVYQEVLGAGSTPRKG